MTNKKKELESLFKEVLENPKSEKGEKAKVKFDIIKSMIEHEKNKYQFINMILLALIAITNIVFTILNYYKK